jgi:hypothetical protein
MWYMEYLTEAPAEPATGALPLTALAAAAVVRVGTAAEREVVVEDAVLKRAVGLAAVVEVVDGRVAIDEDPTTDGRGLTGVEGAAGFAGFAAGAPGRALVADRTLLVEEARVDLLSDGFGTVAPGRAVVPVARFARPLAAFFSSPDANVPGPS